VGMEESLLVELVQPAKISVRIQDISLT
jgi:hypothetical protein